MDRISGLPDELLMKVLKQLPTKDAVSTSLLSKRWESLWMHLPNLQFKSTFKEGYQMALFQYFLDRNLPIHKVRLESFLLDLENYRAESISQWIVFAIQKSVKVLELKCTYYDDKPSVLPMNLYMYDSLVILKLNGEILMEVPRQVHLPSLKVLHLEDVRYLDTERPLENLLSNCPILEDLRVKIPEENYLTGYIAVFVITLQSLSILLPEYCDMVGFKIETPYLKSLKIRDHCDVAHTYSVSPMPYLMEADIDIDQQEMMGNLFRSIKSVKRLRIYSESSYLIQGFSFNNLEHLSAPKCQPNHINILFQLLHDSPNLKELDVFTPEYAFFVAPMSQPPIVPKCVLSSITTFKTSICFAFPDGKDLVLYILKNAGALQTATLSVTEKEFTEKMKIELELAPRAMKKCKIVFVLLK